jgi:hypothetical protein
VETGRASSMAEAIDQAVLRARRADSIERLERDTAAYFQKLSRTAADEESRLEAAVAPMVDEIDFDSQAFSLIPRAVDPEAPYK